MVEKSIAAKDLVSSVSEVNIESIKEQTSETATSASVVAAATTSAVIKVTSNGGFYSKVVVGFVALGFGVYSVCKYYGTENLMKKIRGETNN